MKVGLIVGSLRKDSWNRKVAEVAKGLFPENVEAEFVDISQVPLYNQDLDGENPIEAFKKVREDLKAYDAYLFFTPEYNRSYGPAIKNLIDVGSRDPEGNLWAKKPAGVFSASMGGYGAMAGNHALRQAFIYVDLIAMQQPEVYLAKVQDLFDENGKMVERTESFLKKAVDAFVDHAKMVLGR
ncbi:MAG: NAD(P)H-dependent oxidoreductase [Tissierellia bacterium]|nr:NAD(P)H-dependent oxidoreductase [Tissierellia bacterium]